MEVLGVLIRLSLHSVREGEFSKTGAYTPVFYANKCQHFGHRRLLDVNKCQHPPPAGMPFEC